MDFETIGEASPAPSREQLTHPVPQWNPAPWGRIRSALPTTQDSADLRFVGTEMLAAGAGLGHAQEASAIMKVVAAVFAASGSGGFTSASAVVGVGAGFVFHVALPLRSGQWLVASGQKKQFRVAGEAADEPTAVRA